ncbi:hypothetical protein M0R45_009098 [Rubus argutus]|uniref:Uncharacterized protein n=1 Tax=Rubus argutus TaxID=59490 RepID=A0AAW1Y3Z3_RUBAR
MDLFAGNWINYGAEQRTPEAMKVWACRERRGLRRWLLGEAVNWLGEAASATSSLSSPFLFSSFRFYRIMFSVLTLAFISSVSSSCRRDKGLTAMQRCRSI